MGFSDWWQHNVNDTLMGRNNDEIKQAIQENINDRVTGAVDGAQDWIQENINDRVTGAVDGAQDWIQDNVNENLKKAAIPTAVIAGVLLLVLATR